MPWGLINLVLANYKLTDLPDLGKRQNYPYRAMNLHKKGKDTALGFLQFSIQLKLTLLTELPRLNLYSVYLMIE
jgi:hypothetical protein